MPNREGKRVVPQPPTDLCLPILPIAPLRPPLSAVVAQDCARLGKALADETRVQMVALLAAQGQPLCVCHIESAFALSQSAISYHLKVLRDAGLVQTQRHGTWIYYQLCTDRLRGLLPLVEARG